MSRSICEKINWIGVSCQRTLNRTKNVRNCESCSEDLGGIDKIYDKVFLKWDDATLVRHLQMPFIYFLSICKTGLVKYFLFSPQFIWSGTLCLEITSALSLRCYPTTSTTCFETPISAVFPWTLHGNLRSRCALLCSFLLHQSSALSIAIWNLKTSYCAIPKGALSK